MACVAGGGSAYGWPRKLAIVGGLALYCVLHAPASTETAIADGDTRTLTLINNHTNETGTFTYKVNGAYDEATLDKLNWFMRDWRLNEQTKMDPHLFDILWEVYRGSGSGQPIDVLSAYRSPQTNSMLRHRSRLVAEHSQHMQGRAVDAHFIDVGPGQIRDVAMRMQEGGVGFYPIGSTPWVHIDSGTVRYWPRMSRSALARLFPDGKTVFIPSDGQPMENYAEAKAMIEQRGGEVQTASSSGGLFGWLFGGARGGGVDDEEESGGARVIAGGRAGPSTIAATIGRGNAAPAMLAAAPAEHPDTARSAEPASAPPTSEAVATAEPDANQTASAQDAGDDTEIAAPLPPRKPAELAADFGGIAPLPPRRPSEFAITSTNSNGSASNGDLIATLIERNALPSVITRGAGGKPRAALALTEQPPVGGDPEILAHAAALALPPLPPPRPRSEPGGVTTVARTPMPPRLVRPARPSAANPYGSLVVDAFGPSTPHESAASVDLRGPSP